VDLEERTAKAEYQTVLAGFAIIREMRTIRLSVDR
jgi:hypothetical protein